MKTFLKNFHIKHHVYRIKVSAFSLMELGIVLLIIGVMAGAVFKGQDLLQNAKLTGLLEDIKRYKNAVLLYQSTYGEWPGDDPRAANHFHNAQNGNGDGLVADDEEALAWQHLHLSGGTSHANAPTSKLGGHYRLTSNPHNDFTGLYLVLGQGDNSLNGLLSPKQASALKKKADDGAPQEGLIRFMNGADAGGHACLNGNAFDLSHDEASCVMLVKIQA